MKNFVRKILRFLLSPILFLLQHQSGVIIKYLKGKSSSALPYQEAFSLDMEHIKYMLLCAYYRKRNILRSYCNKTDPQQTKILNAFQQSTHKLEADDSIKISFYASARKSQNPNCRLEIFLKSLTQNAANIGQIEVLLAIDRDDDLDYFHALYQSYRSQLRFKIHVSPIRHGYQKLHLYDKDLFTLIAPHTRMLCDYSDDCFISLKHFDRALLGIDAQYSDNIYFIHTRNTNRHEYLGDVSKNMLLLFWVQQAKEPASYFPIFSKKVLDIAQAYADKHDTHQEWSPLCNAWICDCYIDIIGEYVKHFGADRIHYIDLIIMNPYARKASHHRHNAAGLSPNNLAFIKMLDQTTISYLHDLSSMIANSVERASD
ncbi:MAG TPA: hypothetical protein VNC84_02470 [Gammaproteobacteria bacterium]|nr:hypothetical protein [Gammaproteobacteria bacterium]